MTYQITPYGVPRPAGMLGYDGTDFPAVRVDADGHLQIDVLALTTALEDLLHALKSVNTDQLQVRGQNQLISYLASLYDESYGNPSGAGGYRDSAAVAAGQVWHVTSVVVHDATRALTGYSVSQYIGAHNYWFAGATVAIGAGAYYQVLTDIWIPAGGKIRCYFVGSLAADTVGLWVSGHTMTKEA